GKHLALVVEDDDKAAELIRIQLEAEGFEVMCATTAEEALVIAGANSLSLITLDIMLPNMDGWEFLHRVKQTPALRRVPVVIISIEADRNKGFALGAAAVLEKPISRQMLYETLVDLKLYRSSPGESLSVLIVDDDRPAVELIALRLLGLATSISRAYSGRAAIEMAIRLRPDVIVLDLLMPDINGFDVAVELHAAPDTAHIPIIVLTAKQITAEDRKRLQGCVTTILEKSSFDAAGFVAEVRRAMAGRLQLA
ncbi:MAG TPA: response regulator, partial [Gemmatimonadaceae bacterium]|nr:response regulator [Gemmatimonadaceae bacterium]